MPDLSGLISSDSRSPLQRLRRRQLYDIADRINLTYTAGMPAQNLCKLLEAAGVTGLEREFGDITRWVEHQQKDEDGGSHTEIYPEPMKHHTADKVIDYDSVIDSRVAEHEPEARPETKEEIETENFDNATIRAQDARIKAQADRIRELESLIEEKIPALEAMAEQKQAPEPSDGIDFPLEKLLPWQLKHMAAERGIEYKGRTKEELVEELRG